MSRDPVIFRGARIWWDSEEHSGGRRGDTLVYPYSEVRDPRDQGAAVAVAEVDGYVTSEADLAAVRRALDAPGLAALTMPGRQAVQAICRDWRIGQRLDELGRWPVFARFEIAVGGPVGVFALGASASGLLAAVGSVGSALAASILPALTLAGPPQLGGDLARDVAGLVGRLAAAGTAVNSVPAAVMRGAVSTFARAAVDAATPAARLPSIVAGLAGEFGRIAERAAPAEWLAALTPVVDAAGVSAGDWTEGSWRRDRDRNSARVDGLGRILATAHMLRAEALLPLATADEADAARGRIVALADGVTAAVGGFRPPVAEALRDVRARAVEHVLARRGDLRPLVRIEVGANLPALRAAHDLYGSIAPLADLTRRNAAPALLLPLQFEGVSP